MATIRQLAQLAGVSISTVSLALRDDPRVRPDTRQRIRELAEELYYRPNRLTTQLITGTSRDIGCIIPNIDSIFFGAILAGVITAAFEASYHVITLQSNEDHIHTRYALQTLVEQRVSGVIAVPGHSEPIPKKSLLELWSHDVAIVGVDYTESELPIDRVRTDDAQLAELVVGHLAGLGHQHIGFVTPDNRSGSRQRAQAIARALAARGLSTRAVPLICPLLTGRTRKTTPLRDLPLARVLRDAPTPPTALVVFLDYHAMDLVEQARLLGVQVPRDLSVISCSNSELWVKQITPALTAIDSHPHEMGRRAFSLLMQRTQERGTRSLADFHDMLTVPATLVEGDSCAPPRRLQLHTARWGR